MNIVVIPDHSIEWTFVASHIAESLESLLSGKQPTLPAGTLKQASQLFSDALIHYHYEHEMPLPN